jgi:hypothetical protein
VVLAEGNWHVDANDDNTGVIVTIAHMGEEGVESFSTAMPPDNAVEFAKAIVEVSTWVRDSAE